MSDSTTVDLMSLPPEVHELIIRELLQDPHATQMINDVRMLQDLSMYWREIIDKVVWEEFHSIGIVECECWACRK